MNLGLLFPGEMGAAVGRAANARVLWASGGRSSATVERAAAFEDVHSIAALTEQSAVILSICPPAIAEEVAREVASLRFEGLYVDANAISPAKMGGIARLFERVLDGSIIGRTVTRLYLSGDPREIDVVAGLFTGTEVETAPLAGGIGAASAVKMAFSGWNKIGLALTAQAHAIARAHGVEAALEAEGVTPERLRRAAASAWRWGPEMAEIEDSCRELGLPTGMARGAQELFDQWSAHRDDRDVELERLLDELG